MSSFSTPLPTIRGGARLASYPKPGTTYNPLGLTNANNGAIFAAPDGTLVPTNYTMQPSTFDKIIKALAIAGVSAGYGAAGLSAIAPETAASLGLTGSASGSGLASPIAAQGGGFSLAGAGGMAPETVNIFGNLAATPGWLTAAAPYLAGGAIGAGAGAFASGGGASGASNAEEANATNADSGGMSTADILKALGIAGTGAALLGGAGGGLGTQTTTSTPSAQELAYMQIQQQIAEKQLGLLDQQGAFQQGYLDSIRPLLDQQAKLMQQQYDAAAADQSDPYNQQIKQLSAQLLQQQVGSQNELAPLQKQLLEKQLEQAINGGRPTPEQIASIDAATQSAFQSGSSDIGAFSEEALRQLREELAPSLGLRPGDTPILDRGAIVSREATRQIGKLRSDLATANASARLNIPLAQQQVSNATAGTSAGIAQATQEFQAQLAQNALQNRLNLLAGGRSATDLGLTSGTNLVSASRGNPLNFGGSTTVSNPAAGLTSLLGGIGGLATGLGSLGLFKGSA